MAVLRGDDAQALEFFTQAVEFAPENARFHLNRAEALQKLGRTAEAREAYQRAVALDSSLKGTLDAPEK